MSFSRGEVVYKIDFLELRIWNQMWVWMDDYVWLEFSTYSYYSSLTEFELGRKSILYNELSIKINLNGSSDSDFIALCVQHHRYSNNDPQQAYPHH